MIFVLFLLVFVGWARCLVLGNLVPKTALGLQSTLFDPPRAPWAGATKTDILNIIL